MTGSYQRKIIFALRLRNHRFALQLIKAEVNCYAKEPIITSTFTGVTGSFLTWPVLLTTTVGLAEGLAILSRFSCLECLS